MSTFFFLGEKGEAPKLGRKAEGLHQLLARGYAVPQGFVVSQSVDLKTLKPGDIAAAVAKIGGFPVAVRSSAALEDLEGASFAGQYQTFLEVSGVDEVLSAIEKCRASAETPQVKAYLANKGFQQAQVGMNVLIQRMVAPATAGVAFSIHPISGREDEALVELCEGLGEKLVSGHTTPTQVVLKLETGKVLSETVGSDGVKLTPAQAAELSRALLTIQADFARPQDIEWAIDRQGKLWILQSRPITKIQWRSDIEEYTNADFKDGGVSARVCTPLMFSLYRDALQLSMPGYLQKIGLLPKDEPVGNFIDCFYGRPYWNASAVKRALEKVPGFDEKSFDEDLGIQKSYGEKGPLVVPMNLRTLLPAIPIAIKLEREYQSQLKVAGAFGKLFLKKEREYLDKKLDSYEDVEFFSLFKEVLEFHHETECEYFRTIYSNSNYQSDFKKVLEKISKRTGQTVSQVGLMGGLEDVSHLDSQVGLLRLYRIARAKGFGGEEWKRELKEFIAKNYFHGDSELDLAVPRWGERPERIEAIVRGMMDAGSEPRDPVETTRAQKSEFENEVARILRAVDSSWTLKVSTRSSFLKKLKISREYLKEREEMREYSTRSYHLVRKYVLEAGRRLEKLRVLPSADQVFMLWTNELVAYVEQKIDVELLRARAGFRSLMYRGYRDLVPPDELGKGVRQRDVASYVETQGSKLVLRGVGCSPGVTEGTARVVRELEQAGTLCRDDILVTRFTDPGWTPVLGMVRGVVTEVGGLLSHAAVIGREYGIPAVLNLQGATQVLRSGQKIRVDGTTGVVEVLD